MSYLHPGHLPLFQRLEAALIPPSVGKKQISHDGLCGQALSPHSLLLFGKVEDVPGEGNPNGYELVTSCFVQYACKSSTMKALAAMALGLHWSGIMVMLYEVMLWLLLWLLHQPWERLYYGCRASQERIKVSAVLRAPRVSFEPLSSHLAYPGFSGQCGQCGQHKSISVTNRISDTSTLCVIILEGFSCYWDKGRRDSKTCWGEDCLQIGQFGALPEFEKWAYGWHLHNDSAPLLFH